MAYRRAPTPSLELRTLTRIPGRRRGAGWMRALVVGILGCLLAACAPQRPPVPVGEVPAVRIVSAEDEQYGQAVLAELVERYPLDSNDANIERVRAITDRLTAAANASTEPWHVYVLKDDSLKNAAATRGNYIFVWTGMLKTVTSDAELATVLAHEIGHVLAGHTERDPSEEAARMIAGVAGAVAGHAVSQTSYGPVADLAQTLVEVAIEAAFVNPASQEREFEADHIGLFLMADAGYDPAAGLEFWRRAQFDDSLMGVPLEFLSTHPSTEERFTKLSSYLPEATERFARSTGPTQAPPRVANKPRPLDAPPGERTRDDRSSRDSPVEIEWIVDATIVPVYAAQDTSSEVVAELAGGATLRGTAVSREWVEITSPAAGFIEKVDLAVAD